MTNGVPLQHVFKAFCRGDCDVDIRARWEIERRTGQRDERFLLPKLEKMITEERDKRKPIISAEPEASVTEQGGKAKPKRSRPAVNPSVVEEEDVDSEGEAEVEQRGDEEMVEEEEPFASPQGSPLPPRFLPAPSDVNMMKDCFQYEAALSKENGKIWEMIPTEDRKPINDLLISYYRNLFPALTFCAKADSRLFDLSKVVCHFNMHRLMENVPL